MLRSAFIRVIYLFIMFAAGLVLSNLALPERFGTITLLVLNASLLSIVTGLGTDSIVLHKMASKKWSIGKAVQFTWQATGIQVVLFLTLELASLLFWNKTLLAGEELACLHIEVLYFIGLLLTEKYLALLYSVHKARIANIVLAATGLVYLASLLLVYYFIEVIFQAVIVFFALQSFVQGIALVVLFHVQNETSYEGRLDNKEFLAALKLASVVMITNGIQMLAYRVDFWLLKYFYSNYEVGVYAQANKFANLIWVVPNILAQLLIPRFSLLNKSDVSKVFSLGIYLNIALAVTTLFVSYFFFMYCLNPTYQAGIFAFYSMLPGYFFWAGVIYFGAYFSWAGKFGYNLMGSFCCLAIILVSDLLFIPRYGIQGAAWANTISYTSVFFGYVLVFNRKYGFQVRRLFCPGKLNFGALMRLFMKHL